MAGMCESMTSTVPMSPDDQPTTPARWSTEARMNDVGMVWNCVSMAACQVWPYSCGVVTRRTRLAPKVSVPTTMVIAKMMPTSALRTGTAFRAPLGASVSRMPRDAVTGIALPESQASRPVRDGAARLALVLRVSWLSRHEGHATTAINRTTMATKPRPSTAASTSTPGLGSATRAAPSGMIGEASTLKTTAIDAPTTATTATCIKLIVHSCRWVSPSARKVARSVRDARSCLSTACATITSPVRATTSAKSPSAIASGRMARSI